MFLNTYLFETVMNISNIVLLRIDRLGDLVLTLPAIYSVHKSFPQANIDLVVNENLLGLVEDIPFIRTVYGINATRFDFKKFFRLVFSLRKNTYDLAVDLQPGTHHVSSILLFLTRARKKAGYAVGFRKFFVDTKVPPFIDIKYETELVLDILRKVGLQKLETDVTINYNSKADAYVTHFLNKHKITPNHTLIGISPGSSGRFKCWSAESFGTLIRRLHKIKKCRILLLGSTSEIPLCTQINALAGSGAVNAGGVFDVKQLCACMKQLDLFIGNNSGPMHIAHALKTPSVIISGFANPKRWIRPDANCIVINKDPMAFEAKGINASNVSSVSVDEVFDSVQKLLKRTIFKRKEYKHKLNDKESTCIKPTNTCKRIY